MWGQNANGTFTAKQAYNFLCKSEDGVRQVPNKWKDLWKMKCPKKFK